MRILSRAEFEEIIEEDSKGDWTGDNAFKGLCIINKYIPNETILIAAEHDEIYSVEVKKILNAGLTREDAIELRELNWGIDRDIDQLHCFV